MSKNKMLLVSNSDFHAYVLKLYEANNFEVAFDAFKFETIKLGFDGALYSYIPRLLIQNEFDVKPVFHVSQEFNSKYLYHYTDASFECYDSAIKAVDDGVSEPFSWNGDLLFDRYLKGNKRSQEVFDTAKQYGICDGITIPLLSSHKGIAGASVVSDENRLFNKLMDSRLETLTLYTRLFHNLVLSNASYQAKFIKPLLDALSNTEMQLLVGLSKGRSPSQMAYELNKSEGYLEQVMLKIRRKFSGSDSKAGPLMNRNQLLFYAGLLDLLNNSDS